MWPTMLILVGSSHITVGTGSAQIVGKAFVTVMPSLPKTTFQSEAWLRASMARTRRS